MLDAYLGNIVPNSLGLVMLWFKFVGDD
jgi:hypothetical protein